MSMSNRPRHDVLTCVHAFKTHSWQKYTEYLFVNWSLICWETHPKTSESTRVSCNVTRHDHGTCLRDSEYVVTLMEWNECKYALNQTVVKNRITCFRIWRLNFKWTLTSTDQLGNPETNMNLEILMSHWCLMWMSEMNNKITFKVGTITYDMTSSIFVTPFICFMHLSFSIVNKYSSSEPVRNGTYVSSWSVWV